MLESLQTLALVIFVVVVVVPALYGIRLFVLAVMTHRCRARVVAEQAATIARYRRETPDSAWPRVTTQVPLYNEVTVARRVLEAVARMDYPRDRHEIQVLDDSTDQTCKIVERVAAELRAAGHDIKIVRRPDRAHYKAGAMAYATPLASGEYIAIFDADFIPGRQFLRQLVPLIATRPDVACVQGRWGHLNGRDSWITEALALGIDGHFGVEQTGRAWNGLLFNFNGTAGVWRRSAIEDPRVGGWQGDTITEDLDLSYRAQLAGWKMLYCPGEVAPAEIPDSVDALKAQQRRWATGSMQTARKLLPRVWASPRLTLIQKLESSVHLTQYAVNVFMVLAVALGRTLLWFVPVERYTALLSWSSLVCLLAAGASWTAYCYGRISLGGSVGPMHLLKLIVLGLGLSINNTVAVLVGLLQKGGEFVRTPKSGTRGGEARGSVAGSPYAAIRSRLWMVELAVGAFCLVQWLWFLRQDNYVGGTFLLLYAIGLFCLGWASRPRDSKRPPARPLRAPKPRYQPARDAVADTILPADA
ncbi:MAG TPA: glycosyltransferase [Phycisphaerae bacterium]|nr:glycosyltransferase [Phycisphaerae bacterium]